MTAPRRIEKAEADRALRAAAFTTTDECDDTMRHIVHTFSHAGVMALGADWDLEEAFAFVARADEVAWVEHPLRHDLVARVEERVVYFDAVSPDRTQP